MLGFHSPHRGLCAEWISCLNRVDLFLPYGTIPLTMLVSSYTELMALKMAFSQVHHMSTFFSFAFESWFLINFSPLQKAQMKASMIYLSLSRICYRSYICLRVKLCGGHLRRTTMMAGPEVSWGEWGQIKDKATCFDPKVVLVLGGTRSWMSLLGEVFVCLG